MFFPVFAFSVDDKVNQDNHVYEGWLFPCLLILHEVLPVAIDLNIAGAQWI